MFLGIYILCNIVSVAVMWVIWRFIYLTELPIKPRRRLFVLLGTVLFTPIQVWLFFPHVLLFIDSLAIALYGLLVERKLYAPIILYMSFSPWHIVSALATAAIFTVTAWLSIRPPPPIAKKKTADSE